MPRHREDGVHLQLRHSPPGDLHHVEEPGRGLDVPRAVVHEQGVLRLPATNRHDLRDELRLVPIPLGQSLRLLAENAVLAKELREADGAEVGENAWVTETERDHEELAAVLAERPEQRG